MLTIISALLFASQATTGSCGYVSDYDIAPRNQQLHFARIQKIDGHSVSAPFGMAPMGERHRLTAGTHELTLSEEIDPRYFSSSYVGPHRARSKTITVEVPADSEVYVAAKFVHGNTYRKDYWEPVLWQTKSRVCQF